MKIDLAPIRRELFREMAPSGTLETMTPEERQRVGREVNQRLLGIVQGLQLTAAEIQKKAEAAKQQAAADRAAAEAKAAASTAPARCRAGSPAIGAPPPPPVVPHGRDAAPRLRRRQPHRVAPAPSRVEGPGTSDSRERPEQRRSGRSRASGPNRRSVGSSRSRQRNR